MSVRSDILSWVIRRLHEIDAADPAARHALFDDLRAEVGQGGFGDCPADEALPHLESAIARQEVYWLSQSPPADAPASPLAPKLRPLRRLRPRRNGDGGVSCLSRGIRPVPRRVRRPGRLQTMCTKPCR
jgi:hypothetical protein